MHSYLAFKEDESLRGLGVSPSFQLLWFSIVRARPDLNLVQLKIGLNRANPVFLRLLDLALLYQRHNRHRTLYVL